MLKIGKAGSNLEGAVCIIDIKLIGVPINDPIRPDFLDSPALVGCPGSIFRAGKIVARHIVWQGSANLLKIKGRQTNVDRKLWISGECAREAKKISNDPSAGVGLQDPCTKIDYQCPRLGFLVAYRETVASSSEHAQSLAGATPQFKDLFFGFFGKQLADFSIGHEVVNQPHQFAKDPRGELQI